MDYQYIEDVRKLGFGMFNHFGLYSLVGKGEWYENVYKVDPKEYEKLIDRFYIPLCWAKNLVRAAKQAGCRYITLTTCHHEGFSLFDTCGLTYFDVMHSPTKRDLVKEFTDECRAEGIVPVLYHTVIDWHNRDYVEGRYDEYFEYLA